MTNGILRKIEEIDTSERLNCTNATSSIIASFLSVSSPLEGSISISAAVLQSNDSKKRNAVTSSCTQVKKIYNNIYLSS